MSIRKYDHYDFLLTAAVFLGALALYIRTLAPSLLFGDLAEFQTIPATLGVGHPTGYPVYVLVGRLVTSLPVNSVAWLMNFFSALAAALTVGLVYLIVRLLDGWHAPAILAAFGLATLPLFWTYAVVAEIYTLSAAFTAAILFSVLCWRATGNTRWLFFAGLLGGLSLGIHTTIALAAPAIVLYLALLPSPHGRWVGAIEAIMGVLAGLLIFLVSFLFLDQHDSPAGYYIATVGPSLSVWGMSAADFDTPLERLAFLYLPPQFVGQFFAVPAEIAQTRLKSFAADIGWSIGLALLGLAWMFLPFKERPSRWREGLLLVVAFLAFFAFAITYDREDYYVFFIPATIILSIWVGIGFRALLEGLNLIPFLSQRIVTVLSVLLLLLSLYPVLEGAASAWQRRIPAPLSGFSEAYPWQFSTEIHAEAEGIVNAIEDNAIVFTSWDTLYQFYYVAHVEQGRVGIDFHEIFPQDDVEMLAKSAIAYIDANLSQRPVYITEEMGEFSKYFTVRKVKPGQRLFRLSSHP